MNRIFLNCQFNGLEKNSELISITMLFEKTKKIKHFILTDNIAMMMITDGIIKNITTMNTSKSEIDSALVLLKNREEFDIELVYDNTCEIRTRIIRSIEQYIEDCKLLESYDKPKVIMDVSAYGWVKFIDLVFKNATYNTKIDYIPTDISTLFELCGDADADRMAYALFDELGNTTEYTSNIKIEEKEKKHNLNVGTYHEATRLKFNGILSVTIMNKNYYKLMKKFTRNNNESEGEK